MDVEQIDFYMRNRHQISEWAALRDRVAGLLADAVTQGSRDAAIGLLEGSTGDPEIDFYVRNRQLIAEWDALQVPAGLALHEALLTAARDAGFMVSEERKGWTSARPLEPELVDLRANHGAAFAIFWTKQDLLSTVRGFQFPRIVFSLDPDRWAGRARASVVDATRAAALEWGLKARKDKWWPYWRMLDGISESENISTYAVGCVDALGQFARHLYPSLHAAIQLEAVDFGLAADPHGQPPLGGLAN